MHQEYAYDGDWMEALRQAFNDEEDVQERKYRKDYNFSGSKSNGKRKRDKATTAKRPKNRNIPLKRKGYTR